MTFKVDDREVIAFLNKGLTAGEMLSIEKPMGLTVVNKQRQDVPVDTAATKNSIKPDIQSATSLQVVDHVGPSTDYSPSIEFGVTSKPNYPIQPFVRPSVNGYENAIIRVVQAAFKKLIGQKYG